MAHGIDNEEAFFQFDPYDEQQAIIASSSLQSERIISVAIPKTLASKDASFTSAEPDIGHEDSAIQHAAGKGKAKTMPMPIQASIAIHDLFDISPPSVSSATTSYRPFGSPSTMSFSPASSSFSSPDFDNRYRHRTFSDSSMEEYRSPEQLEFSSLESSPWKGKARESFPVLPPLTFSMLELGYDQDISSAPGPSSYGALYSPPPMTVSLPSTAALASRGSSATPPPQSPSPDLSDDSQDISKPHLNHRHSLSNFAPQLIAITTTVNAQSSLGPSPTLSNISQLILDKRDNNNSTPLPDSKDKPSDSILPPSALSTIHREPGSYPSAWYTVPKSLVSSPTTTVQTQPVAIVNPSPFAFRNPSKVPPYPTSALDIVPVTSRDVFEPLPIVIFNFFDLLLPNELRLHILRALLDLHEQDYLRSVREGRLTMARAASSKNRWVGRDKGIRELFKLSRVSKAWRTLIFDGELWADLDLHSFPGLPAETIVRLVRSAGTFVQHLNLAGHVQVPSSAMSDITNDLCLEILFPYTQLTSINFQGCTALTTRSLHHLLVRSKALQTLSLKGLAAVTNTTCDILAKYCPNLISLNLSRCLNLDAHGISALTVAAVLRKEHLPLKELRLSGLKYISDSMMQALGRVAPYLEVLDLSYARHLHNSALEAFVACDSYMDRQLALNTIVVSARDLGRDANESGKSRRRVTQLRHLVLSFCPLLTDEACANLTHSVPKLEMLELAGIGADLKDDGLIRLLSTTPYIRRLDLEDAIDITDSLLTTITPSSQVPVSSSSKSGGQADKQPGHALQSLNISFAGNVTDAALLALVRNCTQLTVLEADNTRMGATVLKEFINLSRQRKATDARIVAIDCRSITESLVKELSSLTRPRLGWRKYGARKLGYLDARDDNDEDLKIGQDECDEKRVVLKTFYSWQTVDAVKAAREKRRKLTSRRTASESSTGTGDFEMATIGRSARWWSPGGRRAALGSVSGGRNSPTTLPDINGEGCRTM